MGRGLDRKGREGGRDYARKNGRERSLWVIDEQMKAEGEGANAMKYEHRLQDGEGRDGRMYVCCCLGKK